MTYKSLFICLTLTLLTSQSMFSQETAENIINKATKQAKAEKKQVFIMFHASWCGWCKKMEKMMTEPPCKAIFDKYYVTDYMVVKESKDKKQLETPGADALLTRYKADQSGIPFWLFFDKNGKFLDDSFDSKGNNLGCPTTKEEVSQFVSKLSKVSNMSEDELQTIANTFEKT